MTMRIHGDKIEFPDGTEQFTASGGGGDVEAQPPVAFKFNVPTGQVLPVSKVTQITNLIGTYDDDNLLSDDSIKIKKEGYYQINAQFGTVTTKASNLAVYIQVNGNIIHTGTFNPNPTPQASSFVSGVFKLEVDDEVTLHGYAVCGEAIAVHGLFTHISGHMISSITEGEVKEKEAVAVRTKVKDSYTIPATTFKKIEFTEVQWNDKDNFDVTNHCYIPKVEGYYQVNCGLGVDKKGITSFFRIMTDDSESLRSTHAESNASGVGSTTTGSGVVYCNGVDTKISVESWVSEETTLNTTRTFFDAHLITGQSTGGGSGGGDYTPEKMVWKKYPKGSDPVTQRNLNIEYTNDNDVPLYVQVFARCASGKALSVYIDDEFMGSSGNSGTGTNSQFSTQFFVVPVGSTYKAGGPNTDTTPTFDTWHEARMPVAVGTGGKTVAFRGELSANQTLTEGNSKVELDTASIDTDNALVDGKFKPSVAGYYQVNGTVHQFCNPASKRTITSLKGKNGLLAEGTYVVSNDGSVTSVVSDIVYLDGKDDFVELWGNVQSDGDKLFYGGSAYTYLSAVLVSGGSASGDSIWTEEDDRISYDGKVNINTSTGEQATTFSASGMLDVTKGFKLRANDSDTYFWFKADTNEMVIGSQYNNKNDIKIINLLGKAEKPNIHRDSDGKLWTATATMYSAEETETAIDKKLAVKDKLIEKLSDRLDKLEKKLK